MDEKQREGMKTFEIVMSAYEDAVNDNKRVEEAIGTMNSLKQSIEHTLKGTYENPLMGLLNISTGRRKLPQDDQDIIDSFTKLSERADKLLERCKELQEKDPCDHDWIIEETWYNGGGILPTHPYIDTHCTKCESSITSYDAHRNYPIWLKYLTPQEAFLFPKELKIEEGKANVNLHDVVKAALEHKHEFVPVTKTLSQIVRG